MVSVAGIKENRILFPEKVELQKNSEQEVQQPTRLLAFQK